jgi:transposase-like protein
MNKSENQEKNKQCPACKQYTVAKINGNEWDWDRDICMARDCDYEYEYETTTYPEES